MKTKTRNEKREKELMELPNDLAVLLVKAARDFAENDAHDLTEREKVALYVMAVTTLFATTIQALCDVFPQDNGLIDLLMMRVRESVGEEY